MAKMPREGSFLRKLNPGYLVLLAIAVVVLLMVVLRPAPEMAERAAELERAADTVPQQ